ncbi:Winged helix DNA-binding domain superfamily [Arabidopsis thaliana x Arabidopsis arenosa]|uniref:Winged helix DNA-binding domain superfamily n=1 Tax=Arabidopsis thaliana x Arabidopsis arenosa TaxID=1240361 RepID=A0A8T1XDD4_9BRAS|nr:Winged helix DNA-binding domain superfamily [Arabidopsis thaliana x Arabidopsis arenosa]
MSSLPLRSGEKMVTPSISDAVPLQAPAEDATADFSQPQSPSHEVVSLPVAESSSDDVVVVSEIPSLSPSDDDFDHERNSGEDRDQDHGDNLVETDVVVVPVDELKQKIIRQVEYYFSDENLPTDKFLLNAMTRNKKGFVPISTIATFHKMKKLTRDHALIVSALKESSFLVVSSDEKKVKRLSPLPEVRDPKIFTVLVENLPEDHSDENIREIFGKAGSIKSVSICDPNAAEEPEKGAKKEKFIRTRLHAFVEYETVEAAEKAAATLNNEQDWRNGLRVKLLEQTGKFAQRRPARREVDKEKDNTGRVHDQTEGEKNKKTREHQHHRHHHSDNTADDDGGNHQKDKNGNKGRGGGQGRRQHHQGGSGIGHGTPPSASSSSHHNYHPVEVSKRPPGPKMPDGTRGFTMGRGKAIPPPPTSAQTSHEV